MSQLKAQLNQYQQAEKEVSENEAALNNTVVDLQRKLNEQQEKFEEAGNPDYDALSKMEEFIESKLNQVEKTIRESLLHEVLENNKSVEQKLEAVMKKKHTYADTVKPNEDQPTLKEIMIETRIQDLREANEKNLENQI